MILLNLLSNLFKELVAHHKKSAKTLLKHLKSKNKMFRSIKILVQPFLILQVKLLSSEIYLLKFKKRNNIPRSPTPERSLTSNTDGLSMNDFKKITNYVKKPYHSPFRLRSMTAEGREQEKNYLLGTKLIWGNVYSIQIK